MNWDEDRLFIIETYHSCIEANNKELFRCLSETNKSTKDILPIIKFLIDRISTVWFLTLNDSFWDAEIINRSVLETLLKLIFIIKAPDKKEAEVRVEEFWQSLWEINSLKHSEHSKKHLQQFKDKASKLAHISLVLSSEEEKLLKTKWNRKDRKRISQKWSFSEIRLSLINDYDGAQFDQLIGLAHEYRMSSHVAHGDESGIGMVEERKLRTKEEKEIANRAHFVKLVSGCLSYSAWIGVVLMEYLKKDKSFFFENHSKVDKARNIEQKYHMAVFDDSYYDEFRKDRIPK